MFRSSTPSIWFLALSVYFGLAAAVSAFAGDPAGRFGADMVYPPLAVAAAAFALVSAVFARPRRPASHFAGEYLLVFAVVLAVAFLSLTLGAGIGLVDALMLSTALVTTTHAEVVVGLDAMPLGFDLFRSAAQVFGAIWFIQFTLVSIPYSLFAAAAPSEDPDFTARLQRQGPFGRIALRIALVFAAFTALAATAFVCLGLGPRDAYVLATATVSLGGFTGHDADGGYYSDPVKLAAAAVMLISALSYALHIKLFARRSAPNYARNGEVLTFLSLFAIALACVHGLTLAVGGSARLPDSVFNIASLITTTGMAASDYSFQPVFGLVFLMLGVIGGCAGSPSGGIKVARVVALGRIGARLFRWDRQFRYGAVRVDESALQLVPVMIILWIPAFILSATFLTLTGLDGATALSATASNLTNSGPALGALSGPAGSYAAWPDASKIALCAVMLFGRFEFGVVFAFLSWRYWSSVPDIVRRQPPDAPPRGEPR